MTSTHWMIVGFVVIFGALFAVLLIAMAKGYFK